MEEYDKKSGLNKQESAVMDLTVKLWASVRLLSNVTEQELQEACFAIHVIQGLAEHRCCKRFFPNYYR